MRKKLSALLLCLFLVLTMITVPSLAEGASLKITQQPKDCYADFGTNATVSVSAEGDDLQYQWYFKNASMEKFSKASITSPTYSCEMSKTRNGRSIYCVITDRYGNSVTSNTVVLKAPTKLTITAQPKNCYAELGAKASVSVTAQGDGLKYQWYFKNASMEKFSKASITSPTYSCEMSKTRNGRSIYCVITDRYGNSVTSDTVVLKTPTKLTIETQPKNYYADSGEKVIVTVVAQGDELQYQWYFKNASMEKFSKASITSPTYSCEMSKTRGGRKIYCVITDCHGDSVQTDTVTLYDNANLKQVALTFDDGPSSHTARLLDFLAEHEEVKVTFFMVGDRMDSYSSSVKRIADQGHEIGYHSYSHQTQTGLSDSQIQSDFNKSNQNLKSITGKEFTLWRTPGGNYNTRVLNCVPLPHIMWSVDTRDWSTRNTSSVYSSIVGNANDGSIVLLHDLYGTTVDGAIQAIERMLKDGYEFVTVSELLSRDGTPPEPSTNYYRG